ncbi:MAG: flagellar hook protein [Planctomycetota bacterium]
MALLPVSTVRTSSALSTQRLLFQLSADQLAIQRQYDQLSTGRRVLRISDDPAAAGRALGLQRGIDRAEQLVRNANSAEAYHRSTDTALDTVDQALIEARALAVEGASNVLSDDEREALAISVRQQLSNVFSASNAMFRDHQLLGGILEPENALSYDPSGKGVVFQGTDAVGYTALGAGTPSAYSVSGNEALGLRSVVVEGEPLNAGLDRDTRLVDMKAGKGVGTGSIRISGGLNFQTIDLAQAATIGDVIDAVEAIELDGRALTATITSDSLRIEYSDGLAGTLAIADSEGSTLAADLGVENASGFSPPPLIGTGLAPRVTSATRIADLNFGAGLDLSDGIRIQQGPDTFDVDFTGAETLGDVLIAINRSGADVEADLNESEGRIRFRALRSGVDYSIGERGGDTATQLGIRSATEDTRLDDLGRGLGVRLNNEGPDLVITRPDGTELELELEGANSVQDVIDLIDNHPDNQDTLRVLADLSDFGNGLQLKAPPGAGTLTIRQVGLSDAGIRLGLIPDGQLSATGQVTGGVDTIAGVDFAPRYAGGAVDTLIRLEDAIRDGNLEEIERLQIQLDVDFDRSVRTRGKVGTWSQNLDQLRETVESETVLLQDQKSNELDADFAKVVSDLTQRQSSLEASMRFIGQTAQLSVLNFL